MNSIHRLGLAISGTAAVLTIGAAFVVQGYASAQQAAKPTANAQTDSQIATPTDTPTATPSIDPNVIYVLPQATPPVITIKKVAPPAKPAVPPVPAATPPVIHIIVTPTPGGDDHGGGDD